MRRHKTLGEGAFEERIEVSNFGMTPAEVSFAVRVDADFSDIFEVRGFTRAKRGSGSDPANRFLDHGNYLAYGLAASACWVLGLPHGLAVLHGKTRRGGLVFDVADLVKDATILPQAFLSAMRGDGEQEFRQACIDHYGSRFRLVRWQRVASLVILVAVVEFVVIVVLLARS